MLAGAFPVVDLIGEQIAKKAEKKKRSKGKKSSSNTLAERFSKAPDGLLAVKKVPRRLEKKQLKALKKAEQKELKKKLKEKKSSAKQTGQIFPHDRADRRTGANQHSRRTGCQGEGRKEQETHHQLQLSLSETNEGRRSIWKRSNCCKLNWSRCRLGSRKLANASCCSLKGAMPPAREERSSGSRKISILAAPRSWPSPNPRTRSGASGISSVTSKSFPRKVRSSSSTAPGTTARASNT